MMWAAGAEIFLLYLAEKLLRGGEDIGIGSHAAGAQGKVKNKNRTASCAVRLAVVAIRFPLRVLLLYIRTTGHHNFFLIHGGGNYSWLMHLA